MEPSKEDPSIGSVVGDGRALLAVGDVFQIGLGQRFKGAPLIVGKRFEQFGRDVGEGPSVHAATLPKAGKRHGV